MRSSSPSSYTTFALPVRESKLWMVPLYHCPSSLQYTLSLRPTSVVEAGGAFPPGPASAPRVLRLVSVRSERRRRVRRFSESAIFFHWIAHRSAERRTSAASGARAAPSARLAEAKRAHPELIQRGATIPSMSTVAAASFSSAAPSELTIARNCERRLWLPRCSSKPPSGSVASSVKSSSRSARVTGSSAAAGGGSSSSTAIGSSPSAGGLSFFSSSPSSSSSSSSSFAGFGAAGPICARSGGACSKMWLRRRPSRSPRAWRWRSNASIPGCVGGTTPQQPSAPAAQSASVSGAAAGAVPSSPPPL
mmetsp:Transcript_4814/g.16592  ORF Transcript_4814/g.16592 Transcript_4814/m.16592 type:complete len:306 (+) Transcript_4814:1410-2327(+)